MMGWMYVMPFILLIPHPGERLLPGGDLPGWRQAARCGGSTLAGWFSQRGARTCDGSLERLIVIAALLIGHGAYRLLL